MSQYTTIEEAKSLAKALGDIGGGVLPYIPAAQDRDNKSGIYIPEYLSGPFMTPSDGKRKFYHFRFKNGGDGFNAGLIKATMAFAPTRWPVMIALEVNAAGASHRSDD